MAVSKKRKATENKKPNTKKLKTVDSLDRLSKIVNANYFVTFEGTCSGEALDQLKTAIGIDKFELKQKTSQGQFLVFNADINKEKKSESFGVIIGPNAESEKDKISNFYKLWGKEFCSLRRFQDGNTHETIALTSTGISYMPLTKLAHLLKVHNPQVKVQLHHFNEDFRREGLKLHQELLQHRKKVDDFCQKVRDICEWELPLRKIQAQSVSMYKGYVDLHRLYKIHSENITANKVVRNQNGIFHIQENSKIAPSQLKSVKIVLEVSEKNQMSMEMFARLKMAYAIKMQEKLAMKTVLKNNGEILALDSDLIFKICLRPPYEQNSNLDYQLQEKLASIALHHTLYPALCKLVHKWLASQFLSKTLDETLVDVLISVIFQDNQCNTIENGFLRFLHMLSFNDFMKVPLILGSRDEKIAKAEFDFSLHRERFPNLTIFITDLDLESNLSRKINSGCLRRLINCARATLHRLSSNLDFDQLLKDAYKVNECTFDVLIVLKPFQVPALSKSGKYQNDEPPSPFPIVDYDPLETFWHEINQSFGQQCQFYLNATSLKIGMKLGKKVTDWKLLLEDIRILGKDFIKECIAKEIIKN